MIEPRLVLIEWEDSTGGSGNWGGIPREEPKPLVCRSVGWLVIDGARAKIVVPHMHDDNKELGTTRSGCGDMTIPARAVLRIVDLKEA